MDDDHFIERDVDKVYVPNTLYGVGGGGKEAVLQMFEQDWFAVEVMRGQRSTVNVYLVDTTANEREIEDRVQALQERLNALRDRMRERLEGRIGGVNVETVRVTESIQTDRYASLIGERSVEDVKSGLNVAHWWLEKKDLIEPGTSDMYDFSKGACRCRAIGKAFHYKALAQDTSYELTYNLPGEDSKVAIFAGLAGGTGSGLAIDVAKRLYEQHAARRITLFASIPGRDEKVKERANALAALSELEYQSFVEEDDIFDNIVLFPLEPLSPDIEVEDEQLRELDQAMTYAVLGYYNSGHYDDAVMESPAFAPFTIALPQVFRYNIEDILQSRDNAVDTLNRKVRALNAEGHVYQSLIEYVDEHYGEYPTQGVEESDVETLRKRIQRLRELVELPLFEELGFESARDTGEVFLNEIYDAGSEEDYTEKSLSTAFAENELDGLLQRRLDYHFNFEYDDVNVGTELSELDELDDERLQQIILAEVSRLRENYRALKMRGKIRATRNSGDESVKNLVSHLLDADPSTQKARLVNAVERHRDEFRADLDETKSELDEVESEIDDELQLQQSIVETEVENWEDAVRDDLRALAELRALNVEDEVERLVVALEDYAADLEQAQTPPQPTEVENRLASLRETFDDVDGVDFRRDREKIWREVEQASAIRQKWNEFIRSTDRGVFDKVNPFSSAKDSRTAKGELRTKVGNLNGEVYETPGVGPNVRAEDFALDVVYDPFAKGEILDRIERARDEARREVVGEFESRLRKIAEREESESYRSGKVDQFRERLSVIDDADDLAREREDLVEFVEDVYTSTASEDLPELESRRDTLRGEAETLQQKVDKYDDLLATFRSIQGHHDTFVEQHASFTEDLDRQAERFETSGFAEYQPTGHYIHKYTPENTLRAIEENSLAQTELFQEDWEQNERGRIQDFTQQIVRKRAVNNEYVGLVTRRFGNTRWDFEANHVHVAKISAALDQKGTNSSKLRLDDLEVRDGLEKSYNLDEVGQGRSRFSQWAIENGGPWDVGMTFFVQGLGFLDNLRDAVEKSGYKESYERRRSEIHDISLHHSYGLERGFYVYRDRFVDPTDPEEQRIFFEEDTLSIRRSLCDCLECVPLADDATEDAGAPSPVAFGAREQVSEEPGDPAESSVTDSADGSADTRTNGTPQAENGYTEPSESPTGVDQRQDGPPLEDEVARLDDPFSVTRREEDDATDEAADELAGTENPNPTTDDRSRGQ